jgi:hypothetical protein
MGRIVGLIRRDDTVLNRSRFVIRNDGRPMNLNIEPEGVFFQLDEGHEVSVTDVFSIEPATLIISCDKGGDPVVSIWPGDGKGKVEKNGFDVLDLI